MIRLLADENFDGRILDGIRTRLQMVDIIRVQDTDICQAADPVVLAWAASENRVLLSHDVSTLIHDAYNRVRAGAAMPGVIEVHKDTPIGQAVDELEILIGAGQPEDFENLVRFVPMR